jgi:hypothetical protein
LNGQAFDEVWELPTGIQPPYSGIHLTDIYWIQSEIYNGTTNAKSRPKYENDDQLELLHFHGDLTTESRNIYYLESKLLHKLIIFPLIVLLIFSFRNLFGNNYVQGYQIEILLHPEILGF